MTSFRSLLSTQPVRQGGLLAALLLATLLFPKSSPLGIYALGATAGMLLALQAAGIILVYRSNRIINFAQVAVGAFGGYVFQLFETYQPLLRWFSLLCGDSCDGHTADLVSYWVSFALGIVVSVVLSGLVYLLAVRRFVNSARLLLTVATIFVTPALVSLSAYLPNWVRSDAQVAADGGGGPRMRVWFPFQGSFEVTGVRIHVIDVVTLVVATALLVGLVVYLRLSRTGAAIRASAENPDRASTLGINVNSATSRIWLLAGLLSGVAGVLTAAVEPSAGAAGDMSSQVLLLTGAAIAALRNLPLAVAACLVLDMVKQATQWAFGSSTPFSGSLLLVLAVSFVLQRGATSRGEIELASSFATTREIRPVPRELAGLSTVKLWRRGLFGFTALMLLAGPLILSPAQLDALTTVVLLGMVALSLLVLTGWAGQISLGQIGFAGIGAYVAAVSHLPFYAALPLGVLAGGVAAVVVGYPALRLRGLHLAIMSLALAVSIQSLLLDPEYGGQVLPSQLARPAPLGIDFDNAQVYYYLALVALALAVVGVMGLRRSRTARALLAARDNELAAQSLGIGLVPARLRAFAVSGALAAAAGVLLAYQQHAVHVASYSPDLGVAAFEAAVVGGLGTVLGPLLGTAMLQLPTVFNLPAAIALLFSGIGAMAVLLLIPGGIAQALFNTRDQFLRRLAAREGIEVPSLSGQADTSAAEAAPLLPRSDETGADDYVPVRYRLSGQWALNVAPGDLRTAITHEALTGARHD